MEEGKERIALKPNFRQIKDKDVETKTVQEIEKKKKKWDNITLGLKKMLVKHVKEKRYIMK